MIPSSSTIDNESSLYRQAEETIKKCIADIGQENHFEYASPIERNENTKRTWWIRKICHKILRNL